MNHKLRHFRIEKSVAFVIQNFMGESTEEMMSSLYEVANTIATNTLKKSRARKLDKKVKFLYKKKLPIQINVNSGCYKRYGQTEKDMTKPIDVDVEIKFSSEMAYMQAGRLETLVEEKLEQSIGLRDKIETTIQKPEAPKIDIPKVLKGVL